MAQKKAGGTAALSKDSRSRRLGIKASAGQFVHAGTIICRQVGGTIKAGKGAMTGRDHTIQAKVHGIVGFINRLGRKYAVVTEDKYILSSTSVVTDQNLQ